MSCFYVCVHAGEHTVFVNRCPVCVCVWERDCATMPGNTLRVQHCLTFATGLVECLCFAGAVFGWASLVFVLKTEGYFSSLCVNTTGVNATQVLGQFDILAPHYTLLKSTRSIWRMKIFSSDYLFNQVFLPPLCRSLCVICVYRLQRTGWTVLACFHHRLLHEQFLVPP